jgi:hypothetical protein
VKRLLLAVALLAAACSKNIQNSDAVRQAIMEYLTAKSGQTGLNMANITVDVTALEFDRDSARASVSFRAKGMPANAGMSMSYTLDRKGDKWVVRGPGEFGANPHGGVAPGTAPGGSPGAAMPPGHPSVGTPGGGQLPAGHPSIGSGAAGAGTAGSKE